MMEGEVILKVTYRFVDEFRSATMIGNKLTQALLGREKYHGHIDAEYHEEHGWRAIELTIEPQSSTGSANK